MILANDVAQGFGAQALGQRARLQVVEQPAHGRHAKKAPPTRGGDVRFLENGKRSTITAFSLSDVPAGHQCPREGAARIG